MAIRLFNFRTVVRQPLPAASLLHGGHAADNSSSAVLALNHSVVTFFEARQTDISDNLGLHIADIALSELIVARIIGILDQLRFRNPRAEARAFDIGRGQVCFHLLGVIVGLGFVGLVYPLIE